jgi:outer membrane receptor for ferrienterochelin and colicins
MRRLLFFLLLCPGWVTAQDTIRGVVTSNLGPAAYAAVGQFNTSVGTVCDGNGRFELVLSPEAPPTIKISCLGFADTIYRLRLPIPRDLWFFIRSAAIEFGAEVVVSAHRTGRRQLDNPVPVNVIDRRGLAAVHALNLSAGLNYQPGLRVETDCQTCNYSQLRINGLSGSHSRILVNGRPMLSDIAGLYVLEQFPEALIERIEVVRGGGSVLYGPGAIAGTVNIISRSAHPGDWNAGLDHTLLPGGSSASQLKGFTSLGTATGKLSGMITGNLRNQEAWDANGDGYSEIPKMQGGSLASAGQYKISPATSLEGRAFYIGEYRRGGDMLDVPAIEATQSEERTQHILASDISLQHKFNERQSAAVFAAAQQTRRTHYTGIDHADGYGSTYNFTIYGGMQYHLRTHLFSAARPLMFTLGSELQQDEIKDEIPAYAYRIAQENKTAGVFFQSDWEVFSFLTLLTGLRIQYHSNIFGARWLPRLAALIKMHKTAQLRFGYATGIRPPQAFDTDLHIAFAGGGVSLVAIQPQLRAETSQSLNASLDFNKVASNHLWGVTLSPFYTALADAFVLVEVTDAGDGNRRFEKTNGDDARVWGITFEGRANFRRIVELDAGFTLQESRYAKAVKWVDGATPGRRFLRTPNSYGFANLRFNMRRQWQLSIAALHTGKMEVLHLTGAPEQNVDALKETPIFTDVTLKLSKTLRFVTSNLKWRLYVGVGNLLDSYQNDFDTTRYRDSNYIYGPSRPRHFFAGVLLGVLD